MKRHPIFGNPLPAGWSSMTVDEVKSPDKHACVAGPFGSDISSKYFAESGVPVIRGSNLRDDLTRFVPEGFVFVSPERALKYKGQHVKGDDLVFTCWGTVGQVGIIPKNGPFEEYIISNKQLKLRVDPMIANPLFVFYHLANPVATAYIRNRAIGAAVPGINLGILKALPLALPSRSAQDKIVEVLAAYDDLIENNARRIAILEDLIRFLYRNWFDSHAGADSCSPTGWSFLELEELVDERRYSVDPRELDPMLPYFGLEHLPRRSIALNTWGVAGDVQSSKLRATSGDILFGKIRPYFHKVGVCPFDAVCSSDTIVLRVKRPENFGLVLACVSSDAFVAHATQTSQGTKMPRANWKILRRYPVAVPPAVLYTAFNTQVSQSVGLIQHLVLKNANLHATRDFLLPKLISGELDVSQLPGAEAT